MNFNFDFYFRSMKDKFETHKHVRKFIKISVKIKVSVKTATKIDNENYI